MIADIDIGGVVLLENVRFHAGEEANDPAFSAQLAELEQLGIDMDAIGNTLQDDGVKSFEAAFQKLLQQTG